MTLRALYHDLAATGERPTDPATDYAPWCPEPEAPRVGCGTCGGRGGVDPDPEGEGEWRGGGPCPACSPMPDDDLFRPEVPAGDYFGWSTIF
jgi:hypothetical protein